MLQPLALLTLWICLGRLPIKGSLITMFCELSMTDQIGQDRRWRSCRTVCPCKALPLVVLYIYWIDTYKYMFSKTIRFDKRTECAFGQTSAHGKLQHVCFHSFRVNRSMRKEMKDDAVIWHKAEPSRVDG